MKKKGRLVWTSWGWNMLTGEGSRGLTSHRCENLPKKNCLNQLVIFGVLGKALLSLLLLRNWTELKPTGIDYVFRASYLQERTETDTWKRNKPRYHPSPSIGEGLILWRHTKLKNLKRHCSYLDTHHCFQAPFNTGPLMSLDFLNMFII